MNPLLPIAAAAALWRWARPSGKPKMTGNPQTDWVAQLAATAAPICQANGVPLSLALAQAAVETAWGRAVPAHNVFGLKGQGTTGSVEVPTKEEFKPGTVTRIRGTFRAFANDAEAVQAWCAYVKAPRNFPPSPTGKLAPSAGSWLAWYWSQGYATASRYPQTVANVSRSVANRLQKPELAIMYSPELAELVAKLGALPPVKRKAAAQAQAAKGWPAA